MHWIGDMLDAVFERTVRGLGRLFKTPAGLIELPPVIRTANAFLFNPAECERRRSVRAMLAHQTIFALPISVDDQFLIQNFYRSDGFLVAQFGSGGKRDANNGAKARRMACRGSPGSRGHFLRVSA